MSRALVEQRVPTEVFEQYAGKWVALRGVEVIAAADSLAELRESPDVTRQDAVFLVPESPSSFY